LQQGHYTCEVSKIKEYIKLIDHVQTFLPKGNFKKKNWTNSRHKLHGQKN
jgi:hypothetical protein